MKSTGIILLLLLAGGIGFAQKPVAAGGTFVISGTGSYDDSLALATFVSLLPDRSKSTVLFIPTASSGIKLPNNYIYIPPKADTTDAYTRDFERQLEKIFK